MIPVMFASSVDNISWELIIMHRWPIKCLQIPGYYFMDGHMRMTISRFLYPAQFVGTTCLFSRAYLLMSQGQGVALIFVISWPA